MEHPGLERFIGLLDLLIGKKTATELADLLECDLRTVQHYLQLLRSAGFLVEYHIRVVPYLSTQRGRLHEISKLVHFNAEEA